MYVYVLLDRLVEINNKGVVEIQVKKQEQTNFYS